MWSVEKHENPRVSVYASVVLALIGLGAAFALGGRTATTLSIVFLVGALSWSFVEYLFHRFLLHVPVGIGKWDYLTVVVHQDHHETPYRLDRVTAPLGISIPAYVLFVGLV